MIFFVNFGKSQINPYDSIFPKSWSNFVRHMCLSSPIITALHGSTFKNSFHYDDLSRHLPSIFSIVDCWWLSIIKIRMPSLCLSYNYLMMDSWSTLIISISYLCWIFALILCIALVERNGQLETQVFMF